MTILVLNKLQDLLSLIGLKFTIQSVGGWYLREVREDIFLSGDFDVSHKCNSWYICYLRVLKPISLSLSMDKWI